MVTTVQKVLYGFLLLNISLVIVNLTMTGGWQNYLGGEASRVPLRTLSLLNSTSNSKGFLSNNDQDIDIIIEESAPTVSNIHPFDKLQLKLDELEWDALKVDEYIRKYWDTEKSFLEYRTNKTTKIKGPILTTSCLHTAGWIVQGLLELQTRPNVYIGLWKKTKDPSLVVYDNTPYPAERSPVPAIQNMRNFIESRPSNESIILQVDMYQIRPQPSPYYIDHHFAIHAYDGQINVYHNWQDVFNMFDWMGKNETRKQRYPMPIDTWFNLLEKALTYTEDEEANKERYEAIWKLFGITETFVYSEDIKLLDPIVKRLRYPWVLSYITHWPSPVPTEEIASA